MKILVAEDAEKVARFLSRALNEQGYDVECCADGVQAVQEASSQDFDLIVLDWMLPGMDGVAVCRELRTRGLKIPILMLTARVDPAERVLALDAGADDFLTKPFDIEELFARVRAQLRRNRGFASMQFGPLRIDALHGHVLVDGESVSLTRREYDLLLYLVQNAGRVVRRTELLAEVWGTHHDPSTKIVEVQISRLRDKLGRHADLVETVRGMGYRLRTP